ncbi:MAG: class II fructose-bisphosphate aldolase [bacterium]
MKLSEAINKAEKEGKAIGHFNISNLEAFNAIVKTAKKLNVPVIIGVSEGERDFFGIQNAVALVDAVKRSSVSNGGGFEIFLNADHTYSYERSVEAIEAGFDAVIIDYASKDNEESIAVTKKVVEYAKDYSLKTGREVLVEGELGYIGQSSKVWDKLPEGVNIAPESLTQPEEAKNFVEATGVNLLAPAVGNVHGVIKGGNPALNIERIREIKEVCTLIGENGMEGKSIPLVLHGASGITDEELHQAVLAGISIVHYNTELRVAYKEALVKSIAELKDEVAPYKYLKSAEDAVAEVVEKKLRIMNGL